MLLRELQAREPCHLAGGAALSGGHLAHRLSRDVGLFVHDAAAHRRACRHVPELVLDSGGEVTVVPLPEMLRPLALDELRRYRDELADRFRRLATP